MKQTAVDWLYERFLFAGYAAPSEWKEKAKEMEKEQQIEIYRLKAIIEFYEQGCGKEGCKATEPMCIKITQTSNADMNIGLPMKQTALNWLEDNLIGNPFSEKDFENNRNIFKEAKQIEKDQIEEAFLDGYKSHPYLVEQYYKETYGKDA